MGDARPDFEATGRRSLLRAAVAGAGGLLALRGPAMAHAGKKKKRKDRCKKCGKSCTSIYHAPGGGKYCSIGHTLVQADCRTCTSNHDCAGAYPHCITGYTDISTGDRFPSGGTCQQPGGGVCAAVYACRT